MKKLVAFVVIMLFLGNISFAQKVEKMKIFRFQPFSLITGSLTMGEEFFNEANTRSTVINIGVRYVNKEATSSYDYSGSNIHDQFNQWKGASLSVERRFYVPGFFTGEKFSFINDKAHFGIYFAPGVKGEFNSNDFDLGGYYTKYLPEKPNEPVYELYNNTGKVNYLSVMPNMNVGLQFTLFQNLYIDTSVGGGIRFMMKNVIEKNQSTNSGGYYSYSNIDTPAIDQFIIKEGVQPNFSFALGLNF